MSSSDKLEWTRFNDFSPGIWQKKGIYGTTGNVPAPPGAATTTNTYRCRSLPGGGLGPMPKKIRDLTMPGTGPDHLYVITGFCINGPLYNSALAPTFPGSPYGPDFPPFVSATPFEAHVIFDDLTATTLHSLWARMRYYSDSGKDTLSDVDYGTPIGLHAPSYSTITRSNPAAPTSPGIPVVAVSRGPVKNAFGTPSTLLVFPDPATPDVIGVASLYGGVGPVLGHQLRLVFLWRQSFIHGSAGGNYAYQPGNETLVYTNPNDTSTVSISTTLVGQEYPVGYGAWASLTASDLLLIKHYGGAYLIQGSIDAPIVRRMPNVVSTAGSECIGAHSSIGFVYGVNRGGVYAWGGGDGSGSISPQMEDGFWQSSSVLTYLFGGTFMSWGDMIMCPNSFVFDINTKGWWRIDDTADSVYFMWQRDPINNVMYGCLPQFTDASPRYASGYDRLLPSLSYSWQSQPWFADIGRLSKYREGLLCVTGDGTITLTLTSMDTGTSTTKVVTVNSTNPKYYRFTDITAEGTRFQLRIQASGVAAAPVVEELHLGWQEVRQPGSV